MDVIIILTYAFLGLLVGVFVRILLKRLKGIQDTLEDVRGYRSPHKRRRSRSWIWNDWDDMGKDVEWRWWRWYKPDTKDRDPTGVRYRAMSREERKKQWEKT